MSHSITDALKAFDRDHFYSSVDDALADIERARDEGERAT